MLTYRLYYLSKDIHQFVAAVYNPLRTALQERYNVIMIQMKKQWDGFFCFFVGGDFNQKASEVFYQIL